MCEQAQAPRSAASWRADCATRRPAARTSRDRGGSWPIARRLQPRAIARAARSPSAAPRPCRDSPRGAQLLDLQLGQRAAGLDAPHRGDRLLHDDPVDPSASACDEQIDRQCGPQPDEGQHQRWECGGQDRRKRGHPSEGRRHRCAAATILEQNASGRRIRCIAVHMQNGAVRVHQHVCRPSGLPPPEPTAARATAVADSQRRREATP